MKKPFLTKSHPNMAESLPYSDVLTDFIESNEIRCPYCRRMLGKGNIGERGCVEYKCNRCKRLVRFVRI